MVPESPRPTLRPQIIHLVLVAFAVALVVRAGYVQLWQHDLWVERAVRQQFAVSPIPAPRGDIEDATGTPIAYSRELVKLAIAPPEVKDLKALATAMEKAGIPRSEVRRATDARRKWVELRDRFLPTRVANVTRLTGVHVTSVGDRVYEPSPGARQLLGLVGPEGRGASGIELQLDSLLRGSEGRTRLVKGIRGARFESPEVLSDPPARGHTVRLTINRTLQGICDKALRDAVTRLRADGGDVVVLDPRNGEVRCLAGQRPGNAAGGSVTAFVEPYEPGSTLKPFFAARLLERKAARPDEVIETFNGKWVTDGRTITDVHKAPRLSLRDVIRFSSNVGIARFSLRLADGDMYEMLRDLGFGTATGVPYPSEASGLLRDPSTWSRTSHVSLAIGYEIAVTPLQLAAAYGALANDGVLLQPAIVHEVRDAEGRVVWTHTPRVLRRVFTSSAVQQVIPMLESVVDSGTAVDAGLSTFSLAGKSGTARRTVNGRYGSSTYTSSFAGIFPAKDPQLVILAKIDNPRQESIYGGKVAAPLARTVIEAALAAQDASLDWTGLTPQRRQSEIARAALADTARAAARALASAPARPASAVAAGGALAGDTGASERSREVALVDTTSGPEMIASVSIDLARPRTERVRAVRQVEVPDVRGLPMRVAVRELHKAGLIVQLVNGSGSQTIPAAGAVVRSGSTVRLTRP